MSLKANRKHFKVIDENPSKDKPNDYELEAAQIVSDYFKTNVIFQRPNNSSTADLKIKDKTWELKRINHYI